MLPVLFTVAAGCTTTTYRTAQGTEFQEETDLMGTPDQRLYEVTRTLLANGAVALGCPEQRLRTKIIALHQTSRVFVEGSSVYLVEGCGWRATYLRDCYAEHPKGGPTVHKDDYGAEDPAPKIFCQLEIIGKVELPGPAPALAQTPPAGPEPSPQPSKTR